MTVLHADPSMLPAILEIENESFTCPWSERSFQEAFESPSITVYAAVDETNAVLGFSCLMTSFEQAEILNIAVRESARKNGIGQALMDAMLTEGIRDGVEDFYLEVRESNTAARHLYDRNGFFPLGVRRRYYTNPVEDAIVMLKDIDVDRTRNSE